MSSFVSTSRSQQEPSHALRFEAYETSTVHTPSGTSSAPPSLLPDFHEKKPESPRSLRNQLAADNSQVDLLGPEITRLRLDGVQKKWGRASAPSQPSPVTTSSFDQEKERVGNAGNGVSERESSNRESTPAGQFTWNCMRTIYVDFVPSYECRLEIHLSDLFPFCNMTVPVGSTHLVLLVFY